MEWILRLAAVLLLFSASAFSVFSAGNEQESQLSGKVIRILQDFDSDINIKINPSVPINVEKSGAADQGKSCLKISMPKEFNWTTQDRDGKQNISLERICICALSGPYLPPESDAIRMKVKVKSGRAIITVGCPVSQIGNSDVICEPQIVNPGKDDSWQTVELSLNHPLIRNYRRPNFTKDLPVIYFTRWIQEPIYLYLVSLPENLRPQEDTVLYVDQVEVVAKGEGRPFPKFESSKVKEISTIADFETGSGLDNVYSIAHGYSIIKPFEAGYRRNNSPAGNVSDYARKSSHFIDEEGFLYPAPRYSIVKGAEEGRKAIQIEGIWTEEGQITAFKASGPSNANAFKLTMKPDYPAISKATFFDFNFEGKKAHVVDFIVFTSPKGTDFPWQDIGASDELKKAFTESGYSGSGSKYDYLLTTERNNCTKVPEINKAGSFGFYFARRYMPAAEWSEVILPFADFVCVYGQGDCKDMQLRQLPLSPSNISAVGVLAPFGAVHGTIAIDGVSFVEVPGTPEELRSFWQVPDVSKTKLVKLPRFSSYGNSVLMTLGEPVPDYLK